MGNIKINPSAVIGAESQIRQSGQQIGIARAELTAIAKQIDRRVWDRNNIGGRMTAVLARLSAAENLVSRIASVAGNGANLYLTTEMQIKQWHDELASTAVQCAHSAGAFSSHEDAFLSK